MEYWPWLLFLLADNSSGETIRRNVHVKQIVRAIVRLADVNKKRGSN